MLTRLLFDVIRFLGATADRPLLDAALAVREGARGGDVRGIFHRVAERQAPCLRVEAEMIIPPKGGDDLGQTAQGSSTFVRYALEVGYRPDAHLGELELLSEDLNYIKLGDAHDHLRFPHKAKEWRSRVVINRRRATSGYISTSGEGAERVIELHQDGQQGRPLRRLARALPRTVLSAANAAESDLRRVRPFHGGQFSSPAGYLARRRPPPRR